MTKKQNNIISDALAILSEEGFDGMSKMIAIFLNEAMKIERDKALCASSYERTPERKGYANGYKDRRINSRVGQLKVKIPQVRGISFFPKTLEKGMRSEKAFKLAIAEMYLTGVSTRKVSAITEKLCGIDITSSQVSRISKEIDEELEKFRNSPLGSYKYVYLDARYEKVRCSGHILSRAVLWAIGIDDEGKRNVLGVSCRVSEAEVHWRDFLSSLLVRGMHGVKLVISDAHEGLKNALLNTLPGTQWQRCIVHFMRNMNSHIPVKAMSKDVMNDVKKIFESKTENDLNYFKNQFLDKYSKKAAALCDWFEKNYEDCITFLKFPENHWKQLKTTNLIERYNREIKRRSRVVSIFPNMESLNRLTTALLLEFHEEWITGRKFLDMSV